MSKRMLRIGPGLYLPLDAVTQTVAFLARKGAGKTYAAGVLVEELHAAGAQVVVLDPVGNWYGLRLNTKGKPGGLDIPVLGGDHGDIPLTPDAGAMIADAIVDHGTSAILDLNPFRKAGRRQFVEAFAEQLFQRKKAARTPLHLVFEEAQVFAPQRAARGEERMLGAVEDIVRLGRNYGIGATLISQRPQSVNKEVLNQVEALFVLQVNGRHERKAIEEWIVAKGIDVAEMVSELPSLPIGTAFLWSPQWLGILEKVRIRKKRTFDASATPRLGAKLVAPTKLGKVELEGLRRAMSDATKRAEENDPKILRKRIVELERELAAAGRKTERVEVSVLTPEDRRLLDNATRLAAGAIQGLTEKLEALVPKIAAADPQRSTLKRARPTLRGTRAARSSAPPTNDVRLRRGAREMLRALASLGHPMTRAQVATLAGLSPRSGTFSTYLGDLRGAGFIEEAADKTVQISGQGLAYLDGDYEPPASAEELAELWKSKLRAGARRMLDHLLEMHPAWCTRIELAEAIEMSTRSGTFSTYLGDLRRNGLIEERGKRELRAGEAFFLGSAQHG